MSRRTLELYQYLVPAVLAPLSFWLWWQTYDGDLWLTLMAWLIPVAFSYIVPGIGTNVLKVWEFDVHLRLGRFRPQHGFVFGSATAVIAWLIHDGLASNILDIFQSSFIYAAVIGFWNLLYDIHALKSGVLRVYNQPWSDGQGAEAIAMDYAPWFFAGFGAIYGAAIAIGELLAVPGRLGGMTFAWLFPVTVVGSIAVPVWGYRRQSFSRHGHSGCRPVTKKLP